MRKKMNKVLAAMMAAALMITAAPIYSSAEAGDVANDSAEFGSDKEDGNPDGSSVERSGLSLYQTATIEVALPGELAFDLHKNYQVVDYINGEDQKPVNHTLPAQILGEDYNVINYSDVDVRVKIQPMFYQESEDKVTVNSGSSPVTTSGTSYVTDLGSGVTGDKEVWLTAILADPLTTNPVDSNNDGVFEFDYSGGGNILGRTKYVYSGTEADALRKYDQVKLKSGAAAKFNSGAGEHETGVIVLDKKLGSAAFDLRLTKKTIYSGTDMDELKYIGSGCVSSFTLVGLVNPHTEYNANDIGVQAVYTLKALTPNEVEYNTSGTSSQYGQGSIHWSGTDRGNN